MREVALLFRGLIFAKVPDFSSRLDSFPPTLTRTLTSGGDTRMLRRVRMHEGNSITVGIKVGAVVVKLSLVLTTLKT